jgi:hypothetical protein
MLQGDIKKKKYQEEQFAKLLSLQDAIIFMAKTKQ